MCRPRMLHWLLPKWQLPWMSFHLKLSMLSTLEMSQTSLPRIGDSPPAIIKLDGSLTWMLTLRFWGHCFFGILAQLEWYRVSFPLSTYNLQKDELKLLSWYFSPLLRLSDLTSLGGGIYRPCRVLDIVINLEYEPDKRAVLTHFTACPFL